MDIVSARTWYKKVLKGGGPPASVPTTTTAQGQPSGHDCWTRPVAKAANRATVFIENYANIQVVTLCSEKLKKHWTRVYKLDSRRLTKIVAGYLKDFSPLKLVAKNGLFSGCLSTSPRSSGSPALPLSSPSLRLLSYLASFSGPRPGFQWPSCHLFSTCSAGSPSSSDFPSSTSCSG